MGEGGKGNEMGEEEKEKGKEGKKNWLGGEPLGLKDPWALLGGNNNNNNNNNGKEGKWR
jgi:hypothetical protein